MSTTKSRVKRKRKHAAGERYNISPEAFVTAWIEEVTINAVAKRLGMSRQSVYGRAAAYRKQGVVLDRKKKISKRVDWAKLAEFAQSKSKEKGK